MVQKKTINCCTSVSITYQKGFLDENKVICHTPTCGIYNNMEGLTKYYDNKDLKKSLKN